MSVCIKLTKNELLYCLKKKKVIMKIYVRTWNRCASLRNLAHNQVANIIIINKK